jgi:hypothetical protein
LIKERPSLKIYLWKISKFYFLIVILTPFYKKRILLNKRNAFIVFPLYSALKRNVFLFLILVVSLPASSIAANGTSVRDALWNEIYFLGRLGKNWSWQMELHYRMVSDPNSSQSANPLALPYQHLYRPWLHYEPYKWLRLSVSPAMFAVTFSKSGETPVFEPEIRFSIQAMLINKYFGRLILHNRFRYEYRMIGRRALHPMDEFDYDIDYNFPIHDDQAKYGGVALQRQRARYMLRFILPLGKNKTIEPKSFYLIGWSETYFNVLPDVPSREIFDQNRTFLLLGYRIPSEIPIRLELGYGLRTANRYSYKTLNSYTHTTDLMNIIQFYVWFDNVNLFFKKKPKSPVLE